MRLWRSAAVVLALAAPASLWADDMRFDQARVERARSSVFTDEYQATLPDDDGSGIAPASRNGQARGEGPMIDTRDERGEGDVGILGKIIDLLMWAAVVVGAALVVAWLATELLRYGGDAELPPAASTDAAVDVAIIERPLGDAEELARHGEFREAIHTLLLRTLQELVRRAALRVPPSLTSREILARVPLDADARVAFAGLISAVELTHFGGDHATQDDYERCRSQFHVFASAFRAAAARGIAV